MSKKPIGVGSACKDDLLCAINNYEADSKDEYEDLIKDGFEDNYNYRPVYRNFNYTTFLKTWIYEGNEKDKTVGFKYLQSYPYSTIRFDIGDYIHWDYYHVNGKKTKSKKNAEKWSTWLMQSLDYQETFDSKGRILLCNENLRFYGKDNEKISYPCVILDSMKYTTWDYGTKGVIIEGADIVALAQNNEDTKNIDVNYRFIFNKNTYTVTQKNVVINSKLVEFYFTKTPELQTDDLESGYATLKGKDNEGNQPPTEDKNGNILSPKITSISLGDVQEFEIFNYIDGIKQTDEFAVDVYNVPSNYYSLVVIDGNHFSIENLKRYTKATLDIRITNTNTGELIQQNIWLSGV